MASAFDRERVSQHLRIGIETMRLLREQGVEKPAVPQAARLQRTRLPVGGARNQLRPFFMRAFALGQVGMPQQALNDIQWLSKLEKPNGEIERLQSWAEQQIRSPRR
jgi:hypothetical protein